MAVSYTHLDVYKRQAPNKLKVPEEELLSVDIPELNDFAVYEVEYVAEPERYASSKSRVTFISVP